VACRGKRPPGALVRLACTPQGEVILDRSGRLPGRGVYVCFDAVCLRQALKPAKLAAAFRRSVEVPAFATVYAGVLDLLNERLKMVLSLAQKAGAVISGYVALRGALARNRIVCMIVAEDIAASRAEEYRDWCAEGNIPCWTLLTKESLGRVIGRANRSAVGLTEVRFRDMLCAAMASREQLCSSTVSAEAKSGHF
jgi:predicted RNA-binding protein YlxR (DUF448 family)